MPHCSTQRALHNGTGCGEIAGVYVQHTQPYIRPDVVFPVVTAREPDCVTEPALCPSMIRRLARKLRHFQRQRRIVGRQEGRGLGERKLRGGPSPLLRPGHDPSAGIQQPALRHVRGIFRDRGKRENRHPQGFFDLRKFDLSSPPCSSIGCEQRTSLIGGCVEPECQVPQRPGEHDSVRARQLTDDLRPFRGLFALSERRGG